MIKKRINKLCIAVIILIASCHGSYAIAQPGDGSFGNLSLQGRVLRTGPGQPPPQLTYPSITFRTFWPNNSNLEWRLGAYSSGFYLFDSFEDRTPFRVLRNSPSNSIAVTSDGVGIGTSDPMAALNIYSGSGGDNGFPDARLLIENEQESVANRVMLEMVNNGNPRIIFHNLDANVRWAAATRSQDEFIIDRPGPGPTQLVLDADGDLTIAGTLFQASDRNIKENFESVDPIAVLKKVVQLPITSWNFKFDDGSIRHIGPMAQDFRRAFGMGVDDKTIAPSDSIGVSLAAIQGLHQLNAQKDELIAAQNKRIDQLEAQIELIESRLIALTPQ